LTIQPIKQITSLPIDYSTSNPSNPHLSHGILTSLQFILTSFSVILSAIRQAHGPMKNPDQIFHLSPLKRFKFFPLMADIQEGRFALIQIKTGFYI
jgi:hypothetical protein